MKANMYFKIVLLIQTVSVLVCATAIYMRQNSLLVILVLACMGIATVIAIAPLIVLHKKALKDVRVKKLGNPVWIETMIEEKKNEITAELAIVDLLEKRINKLHTERNLIWLFREKDAVRARELSISVLQQIAREAQDNAYHLGILQHYYEDLLERSTEYIEKNERETD